MYAQVPLVVEHADCCIGILPGRVNSELPSVNLEAKETIDPVDPCVFKLVETRPDVDRGRVQESRGA